MSFSTAQYQHITGYSVLMSEVSRVVIFVSCIFIHVPHFQRRAAQRTKRLERRISSKRVHDSRINVYERASLLETRNPSGDGNDEFVCRRQSARAGRRLVHYDLEETKINDEQQEDGEEEEDMTFAVCQINHRANGSGLETAGGRDPPAVWILRRELTGDARVV